MYLEISGRQTGKTTRLVDHASGELIRNIYDPNYTMCIVSPTNFRARHIRDMVKSQFNTKINNMSLNVIPELHYPKIKTSVTMIQDRGLGPINMYYVDEFAFIPSDNLVIYGRAYYCTTPNGDHEFTLNMLEHCRWTGEYIVSYDISRGFRQNPLLQSDIEEFDDFCIEHELEMYPHPFEVIEKKFGVRHIKRHRL